MFLICISINYGGLVYRHIIHITCRYIHCVQNDTCEIANGEHRIRIKRIKRYRTGCLWFVSEIYNGAHGGVLFTLFIIVRIDGYIYYIFVLLLYSCCCC